jgi:EF hand domain-containing protein
MLFALGAVSTAIDALQSLTSSKSSSAQQTNLTQAPANPFLIDSGSSAAPPSFTAATPSVNTEYRPQIAPETMSMLIAVQGASSTSSSGSSSSASPTTVSPQDALKDLFSRIDADGDGKITKSEFEKALGAGGTNVAQADDVFSKLDSNGDGSVGLDEMSKALKGSSSGSSDASGDSSGSGSDPLTGATTTSVSNSDGSTTTTITYADGSKVSMTMPAASSSSSSGANSNSSNAATSSYNWIEQMIQREAKAISANASNSLSVAA